MDSLTDLLESLRPRHELQERGAEEEGQRGEADPQPQGGGGRAQRQWWSPQADQPPSQRGGRHELEGPVEVQVPAPQSSGRLPVEDHLPAILRAIRTQQVTCIQGETGCGKSSAIPLAVVRDAQVRGEAVSVIVTQPRRLAARALAQRVASQLGEEMGGTCGYAVGQDRVSGGGTKLLFVTTGWLLQMLAHNPKGLRHLSHIILDEAHERSTDADFLSLVLRLTTIVPDAKTKLVVMSATLQADLYSEYFSAPGFPRVPPPIFVGARRFPVEVVYADEITRVCGPDKRVQRLAAGVCNADPRRTKVSPQGADLAAALFAAVSAPGRCVLCFLPGMGEIEEVTDAVERLPMGQRAALQVHVLHSLVPREQQDDALKIQPRVCKVVLSTNVAESSLTLPDVTHVVDFCLARSLEYDDKRRCAAMVLKRASQASLHQRAGRAGRVQSGTVVRLIPSRAFDDLEPFDPPEMLSSPLESTVLTAKIMLSALGPAEELLQQALEPPPPGRVRDACCTLEGLGALDSAGDVTALGRVGASMPLDVRVSRMMIIAAGLGRAAEGALLAAALASQDPFALPSMAFCKTTGEFREQVRANFDARLEADGGAHSEPIAVRTAILGWLAGPRTSEWATARSIAWRRMKTAVEMVKTCCTKLPAACEKAGLPLRREDARALERLVSYCSGGRGGGRSARASGKGGGGGGDGVSGGGGGGGGNPRFNFGGVPRESTRDSAEPEPRPAPDGDGDGDPPPLLDAASPVLRMLVVLACPDLVFVGAPYAWRSRAMEQLNKSGIPSTSHGRVAKVRGVPFLGEGGAAAEGPKLQRVLEGALGGGAIEKVAMLGGDPKSGRQALTLFGDREWPGKGTGGLDGDVPYLVKLLEAFKAGTKDGLKLPNPSPSPPGSANPLPDEFLLGGVDVNNKISWARVGAEHSTDDMRYHASWRGPLGTVASPSPHFMAASSVITFGSLGIATGATLLSGRDPQAMLMLLALRSGAPTLGLFADAGLHRITSVRLDGAEVDLQGGHLTCEDLTRVDALREELSLLAVGGARGGGEGALSALAALGAEVAARPRVKHAEGSRWHMPTPSRPREGAYAPFWVSQAIQDGMDACMGLVLADERCALRAAVRDRNVVFSAPPAGGKKAAKAARVNDDLARLAMVRQERQEAMAARLAAQLAKMPSSQPAPPAPKGKKDKKKDKKKK